MKNCLVILLLISIQFYSFGQIFEYDDWHTIYEENGLTLKVNIEVAPSGQECEPTNVPILYQYSGVPLGQNIYQEWQVDFVKCNGIPTRATLSVPLGPELRALGEETMEIKAEGLEVGEYFIEVKNFLSKPKATRIINAFSQKSNNQFQPDNSKKPEQIEMLDHEGKIDYDQDVQLTVKGGYLGKNSVWRWTRSSCTAKKEELTLNRFFWAKNLKKIESFYVSAYDTITKKSSQCVSVTLDVDLSSKKPDTIRSSSDTYCVGTPFKLYKKGGILGPNSEWYWYRSSCSGNHIGTGSFYEETEGINKPGDYVFYLKAVSDDGKFETDCVQKRITIQSNPVAPKSIDVSPSKSEYCEGDDLIFTVSGDLKNNITGAEWIFHRDGVEVQRGIRAVFQMTVDKDTRIEVFAQNKECPQSESKEESIKVYNKSKKASHFNESQLKRKKELILDYTVLADKSEWKWERSKNKEEWKPIGEGDKISVPRSKLNAFFRVRAEGKKCNDQTAYAYSIDGKKIMKESKDAKWHAHHSWSSKPAAHWGFDLGYDAQSYQLNAVGTNQLPTQRKLNVAGSGGYLGMDFHPLMLEGFIFGLNGNVGFGNAKISYFKDYVIEDTSYAVDYNYTKGGFGIELGTMISRNKGPMKLLLNWNRQFFMNDYTVQVSPGQINTNETYVLPNSKFLHENIGFAIRFGRYSPLNKSRERGINWDFRFNLNNYSNTDLFTFEKGYLRDISSWNLGMGLHIWVHRKFKIQADLVLNESINQLVSNVSQASINQMRLGVCYSFDTFH